MKRLSCTLLLLCGCAAQEPSQRSEADPRREIARLEGRIESLMKNRLELTPSQEEAPAQSGAPQNEPRAVASQPAGETVGAPPLRSRSARRSQRCVRMSEAAGEICDDSERICRLAQQLGDGASAHSCGRAREDCRRSRDLAAGCL